MHETYAAPWKAFRDIFTATSGINYQGNSPNTSSNVARRLLIPRAATSPKSAVVAQRVELISGSNVVLSEMSHARPETRRKVKKPEHINLVKVSMIFEPFCISRNFFLLLL